MANSIDFSYRMQTCLKEKITLIEIYFRVLLLEAGGEYLFSLLASVPAFTSLMQNGEADWHYVTESQEHAMRHLVDRVR